MSNKILTSDMDFIIAEKKCGGTDHAVNVFKQHMCDIQ